jgi:hypothetical protein
MITLSLYTTVLTLPLDLDWTDEFTWSPVKTKSEPSITGSLIIDTATMAAGRPITLQNATESGWIDRATLATLQSWANQPGQTFTLTVRGTPRTVLFDHERGAIEAVAIIGYSDPLDTDPYTCTLRFIEV